MQSDEYVVYNQHQQCIRYLVEFTLPGDEKEVGSEEERGEVAEEENKEKESTNDNQEDVIPGTIKPE